jgi:hypothetical protein
MINGTDLKFKIVLIYFKENPVMKKSLLTAILGILISFSIYADAGRRYATREYPWVMRSPAALGMGNAYHAKSDSKYAPFYNPAGLDRIQGEWRADLLPLGMEFSQATKNLGQDILQTDLDNDDELADLFRDHIGEPQHVALSYYPAFTMKDFTVGIFGSTRANAEVANPVLPEVNADAAGDAGGVVGAAYGFLEDRLQAGAAMRVQHRWSLQHSYLFSDFIDDTITDIDYDELEQATGLFFDAGIIFNFQTSGSNPRAGLTINNLGTNSLGSAADLPWSVTLSFGISPSIDIPSFCTLRTDILLDFIDATFHFDQDDDIGKRINTGLEFYFDAWALRAFKFRAGLHQGYPTFGLGLDTAFVRINYARYKEELGAYAGQIDDVRHVVEIVISI